MLNQVRLHLMSDGKAKDRTRGRTRSCRSPHPQPGKVVLRCQSLMASSCTSGASELVEVVGTIEFPKRVACRSVVLIHNVGQRKASQKTS